MEQVGNGNTLRTSGMCGRMCRLSGNGRNNMERIGFIGAGMMGSGIARTLKAAGYPVVVYKRTISEDNAIIRKLRNGDIRLTTDLEQVFENSDVLLLCLPDSPTVETILLGSNGLAAHEKRTVHTVIDFTTAHPDSTKRIGSELEKMKIRFMDAPMTGGPKQAEQGELGLAVGGPRELFETYTPLFATIAKHFQYAGPLGSGNVLKLINNYLSIMNTCAASAVYAMIEQSDIEKDAFYEFISKSGGDSKGFQNIMTRIRKQEFPMGFALKLAHKDISYMKDLFDRSGGFPIFSGTCAVMDQAMDEGYGERDMREVYFNIKEHVQSIS